MRSFTIIPLLFPVIFLFSSCNNNDPELTVEDITPISNDIITRGQDNLDHLEANAPSFFKQYLDSSSSIINNKDAAQYLQPLLANIEMHHYSNKLDYYTDKILAINDNYILLSFRCQGLDNNRDIEAFYAATFQTDDFSLIDCKLINSFSNFDCKDSLGYEMHEFISYTINDVYDKKARVINCTSTQQFKGEGLDKKTASKYIYQIDDKGRFKQLIDEV